MKIDLVRTCRVAAAFLFVGLVPMNAQEAAHPTNLVVKALTKDVPVGQSAVFEISLVNSDYQPAQAVKNLPVTVEVVSPNGATESKELTIKKSEQSVRYELPLPAGGTFEVRARNRELLSGADLIFAKPRSPGATPVPAASPALRGPAIIRALPPTGAARSLTSARSAYSASPSVATSVTEHTPHKLLLNLRYGPQRPFLANGKDVANIFARVLGETPERDTQVFLFNSDGSMTPKPLVIPKGRPFGEAQLTSEDVGKVQLEYWWSDGWVEIDGSPALAIEFAPPIVQFKATASPPAISLLDEGQLVIQLADKNGRPLATNTDRKVTFRINQGSGAFSNYEVTIPTGASEVRTKFLPTQRGKVLVMASSDNMSDQQIELVVSWPALLLFLAGIGGLVGGALAYGVVHRKNPVLYIAGGVVTGCVLFWFVINGLVPKFPVARSAVLNPIGAICVAIVGGWVGTEIFTPILKWMGLGKA
jgi:hypothetical protein